MILRFPYLEEPIQGSPPPSLRPPLAGRRRPLVPLKVHGSAGALISFGRALADPGADDTILPMDVASVLGIALLPASGHGMRWRGQRFPLRYGMVELELADSAGNSSRWPATVTFTAANMRYPLLGIAGCLEFLNARFLGQSQFLEREANASMPTILSP